MPLTAASFGLCALSIMGVPPFGGFFSKYMVVMSPFYSGNIAIGLVFVFGALLTILYLLRVFARMFFGEPGTHTGTEKSRLMVGCVLTFGILSLIAGIGITIASNAAILATTQITGL
jgi:formate hydrogenlyase subunit 3/multisubunit Na+/H+ antiporter MnhD subunit